MFAIVATINRTERSWEADETNCEWRLPYTIIFWISSMDFAAYNEMETICLILMTSFGKSQNELTRALENTKNR